MEPYKEYYKIKYALRQVWTLREAAYLLAGCDPDNSDIKISDKATNAVSTVFYWLSALQYSNELTQIGFSWKEPANLILSISWSAWINGEIIVTK